MLFRFHKCWRVFFVFWLDGALTSSFVVLWMAYHLPDLQSSNHLFSVLSDVFFVFSGSYEYSMILRLALDMLTVILVRYRSHFATL